MQASTLAQFNSLFSASPAARSPLPALPRKIDCGWYDSSFDLARGLEILEDDDDALFQLWALARH